MGEVPVVLHSVENKRNERLGQTVAQNIQVSTGKLIIGDKSFRVIPDQTFKTVAKKEKFDITLKEFKDYFLKVPDDNTKVLKLTYHLVDGKHLYIHLGRYLAGTGTTPELKEIFINLAQLMAHKNKELESIKLKVVVDGPKMENSSIQATPIFKDDTQAPVATSPRSS